MRLLREPLLHFFLIGAAIFAAHALLSGEAPDRTATNVFGCPLFTSGL